MSHKSTLSLERNVATAPLSLARAEPSAERIAERVAPAEVTNIAKAAQSETPAQNPAWWRGASIYQIYPRSFQDSNGDGIGDLPGIIERLDYIASLGVTAIWLSPFFTSPMLDFGYDVEDFTSVDPMFGSLADFDRLVAKAHRLGLKVLIDQVYSHSSDRHRWFTESRQSRTNDKADWYVWADPKPDGTPPNNWQSLFSGPAWSWDARRSQYYLHNFLPQQPDLNLHNREVQDALLAVGRFWLERGVDGFRIDAVLHMMHDSQLRDNPPALASATCKQRTRSHDFQANIYNQAHPDIFAFLERVRAQNEHYGAIFALAEVGGVGADIEAFTRDCTVGEARLNSAYSFDFLYSDALTPQLVCDTQHRWSKQGGWPSWTFENHDAPRAVSRWAQDIDHSAHREAFLRMKIALLVCLRGTIILYQGEELGLEQVDIPHDKLRDPEALRNWPLTLSRDGARTPMPWLAEAEHCGFSTSTPWLPLGENHKARAVDIQQAQGDSLLHVTRRLLALRHAHAALQYGRVRECEARGDVLYLSRDYAGETIGCLLNMGAAVQAIADYDIREDMILHSLNAASATHLPAFAVLIWKIS